MPDHNHVSSPNLGGVDRFASEPKKVEKPWGHELIFAVTERYAGKLLHVKAGQSLSLQFHNVKDEAWYILEGRVQLELGAPGERVRAIEDTTIVEVSTPELDDVVRLEDAYGREGTSEP